MFRISRRLDYGLQLMVALAGNLENSPQSTASLADRLRIPLPFLHQIGHMLMQAGLVKASPGPHGGIRLNRPPDAISLLNIVETLEGPVNLHICPDCDGECVHDEECTTQKTWDKLEDTLVGHLSNLRLDMMVKKSQGTA